MQALSLLQLLSRHALLLLWLQVTNDTASEVVDTRRRLLVNKVSGYKEQGSIDISTCLVQSLMPQCFS